MQSDFFRGLDALVAICAAHLSELRRLERFLVYAGDDEHMRQGARVTSWHELEHVDWDPRSPAAPPTG